MIRLWFNHWFSTAYNIINMIRSDNDVYVICTNKNERSVVGAACDEVYPEPDLSGDEYAEFCISFCKEHSIDVFIPRREISAVSRHLSDFDSIGVKVMTESYDIIHMLSHKDTAYNTLKEKGFPYVPEYLIVNDVHGFEEAYRTVASSYEQVCFKFVNDEGGKSYRLIDDKCKGFSSLYKKQTTRITYADAVAALSEKETFSSLMVMPCLSGDEISADCLSTSSGIIMLPRIKSASKIERMCFDEEILSLIRQVYDLIPLEQPCNIQFKYLHDEPYFLEVNTRMSGGVQMACAAAGVNIPSIALNKLLGKDIPWSIDREPHMITHADVPIVL